MLSRERASGREGEQEPLHLGHGRWLSCSNSPLKNQALPPCAPRCRKGPGPATGPLGLSLQAGSYVLVSPEPAWPGHGASAARPRGPAEPQGGQPRAQPHGHAHRAQPWARQQAAVGAFLQEKSWSGLRAAPTPAALQEHAPRPREDAGRGREGLWLQQGLPSPRPLLCKVPTQTEAEGSISIIYFTMK